MKQIILDTNFLLIPSQFNVDIFSEIDRIIDQQYEIVILASTLDELQNLVKIQRGKNKKAAEIALQLVEHKKIKTIPNPERYVDAAILEIADPKEHIIATQDQELKQKLIAKGIPIITLRKKQHLILL